MFGKCHSPHNSAYMASPDPLNLKPHQDQVWCVLACSWQTPSCQHLQVTVPASGAPGPILDDLGTEVLPPPTPILPTWTHNSDLHINDLNKTTLASLYNSHICRATISTLSSRAGSSSQGCPGPQTKAGGPQLGGCQLTLSRCHSPGS